ncbi:HepT-like ribonuclease domain-containing protein [Robertmurraya mangrovi]|uniref:HepT-like ribonuclease domain-containing protein n=1 Tax=Robertmurraya mangrovi TaxID=3098077 RepID=UPI003899D5C4
MQREPKVFLEDIYTAAVKIETFTAGLSFDDFIDNDLVSDAVIKNILVIGEATKNIPEQIRKDNPQIEWRKNGWYERYDDSWIFLNKLSYCLGCCSK